MESGSEYIELLKKVLNDSQHIKQVEFRPLSPDPRIQVKLLRVFNKMLRPFNYAICNVNKISEETIMNGTGRPAYADTMIGMNRLNNIEYCINEVIKNNVDGDFIELGVW